MDDIRIAAVVFNAPVGQIDANLTRMEHWIAAAQKAGAAVVCFPEMNITGYSNGERIHQTATPIPGPITDRLCHRARRHRLTLLAGMVESGTDGALFASHVVVFPDGRIAVYRKIHIAPPEQALYTAGNQVPIFRLPGFCFGIQLCYDAHFPELTTHMALQGVDAIFLPHASPRGTSKDKHDSWMRHLPARAFDNGLFVVACNQVGHNGAGLEFPGLAMALGPSGNEIGRCLSDTDEMLCVDLRADVLDTVRQHRMRYFFPNRRPEIYALQPSVCHD